MINDDEIISLLESNDYYKVRKSINRLIDNEQFINRIICIDNPFVFDRFIKMCEYKIDTSSIYERRNKFIEAIMLTINKKINIPDKWLNEYIIGYFFQDNYYNFMANFYQMLSYQKRTGKELISDESIKIYSQFKDLIHLNVEEKIKLFKDYYQKNNIMELFYDDMEKVKNDSHKELVDASLKLTHDSPVYVEDISRRIGTDVYYLDGEEFYGFIRCLSIKRNDLSDYYNYVLSTSGRLGYSFSYIGDKNIGTSDYDNESVVLFYDDIDYKNIMYVHHSDLHAKAMNRQIDYVSEKENELLTPSGLIGSTKNYNEIFIKAGDNGIKPKALVCYDRISHNDLAFAEKYDLVLLVINREKYQRYVTYEDDYGSNTYML